MTDYLREKANEKFMNFIKELYEPKPCPFCGANVTVGTLKSEMGYAILHPEGECIWNDTDGPCSDNVYETKEECVKAWNRRA